MHLTCRKIKERRARLQHVHMAPDYIPVAGAAMDTLRNDAKAESGSGSDSEPDAGDQLRMSFLGDTKKRGKAAPGVFAQVAEDAQVPLLPAGRAGCDDSILESLAAGGSATIRSAARRLTDTCMQSLQTHTCILTSTYARSSQAPCCHVFNHKSHDVLLHG